MIRAREFGAFAVGHTRGEAASVFGQGHDEVFLTSYDDFDREVDLTT